MNYRDLGRTGWKVSEISFGAWAIGGSWGSVDDTESLAALHAAIDCGVNFIDTADVYGMGRSEALLGSEVVDQHPMAGPDRGGQRSEAEIADAVLGDVRDRAVQQSQLCVLAFHRG